MPTDKRWHLLVSYALTLTLLVLGTPLGGAAFVALAAGAAWEAWRGWRRPDSWHDLLANLAGVVAAVLVVAAWGRG